MKKIAALVAGLVLALSGLVTSPAQAAYNEVWHSSWSGTYGSLLIVCNGGAQYQLHPQHKSSWYCWNTSYVRSNGGHSAMRCYLNGGWVNFGIYTYSPGAGEYVNCRTYYVQ